MRIVYGDVWEYPADFVCIPVNGDIKKNGDGAMGRGVAAQAVERLPGIATRLGETLLRFGNHVHRVGFIYFFPVKYHWREPADMDLILRSAQELDSIARETNKVFVLPRPGCGNGQLAWRDVRPIIEFLPNNVHVITNEDEKN